MENTLEWLNFIGTFVFAMTGAVIAAKSDFDFFGMLFLGFLTAVGGGTVRDLILDQNVFWTTSPIYLYIILGATFCGLFFRFFYEKAKIILFLFDTIGLGLFAILGAQKALSLNMNYETALIMGVISGVLGGILRSTFSREEPLIFKKEIYATTAAISAGLYMILGHYQVVELQKIVITMSVCLIVRSISIRFNIHLPKAL